MSLRRTWMTRTIIVCVVLAVIAANGLLPWGEATANRLDNAMQLTAGLIATVTALVCGLRRRHAQRRWRLLIAAGMGCWTAGLLFWAYNQVFEGHGLSSPSWADVGFLAYPVFALPAILVLGTATNVLSEAGSGPWTRRFDVGLVLDGVIVTASLFFVSWSGALRTLVENGAPKQLSAAVAFAYPVTDLLLVAVAVLMVVFGRIRRVNRTSFLLLTAGVIGFAVSDSIYAYLIATGAQSMGPWANAGFVVAPVLFTFAVVHNPGRDDNSVGPPVVNADLWQIGLPYGCLAGVGFVVVVQLVGQQRIGAVCTVTGMLVVVTVVIRQLVHALDNRALMHRIYATQLQLLHQAHHDPLTGLANRLNFSKELDSRLRQRHSLALVLIDVDDFKQINDQYGHAAGDRVLWAVGQRLVDVAPPHGMVGRFGGDEFVIVVDGTTITAADLVGRIRVALRTPFAISDAAVSVRVSMGVVVPDADEPFISGDVLLGRADTSMYAAKRSGKNAVVIYRPAIDQVPDFAAALRDSGGGKPAGFCMVYQPVIRLSDGAIVAIEALARWKAQDGSDVEPGLFIPSTEQAGLGRILDVMVVTVVCSEVAEYQLRLPVHVNVGAARLGDREFEMIVVDAAKSHGLGPGQLVLEVTETEAVGNLADGAAAIRRLQVQGIRIALDDFGTGYNSLTYLHELPVDVVKLDRSLTRWLQPERDAMLYRSVVGMCAQLGLDVIAEGVETEEQLHVIRQLGCKYGQGYFFGTPTELGNLVGESGLSEVPGLLSSAPIFQP